MEESRMLPWGMFRAMLAILQWWGFNVTVIIMNKWIFQKLEFKFPLTLSCIHFICSAVGAYIAIRLLKIKPLIEVDPEDRWRRIFPMSFVFCINIVLGNVSLRYIPVSFMQAIKSFTPATTVILQWLVWRKYFEWHIWASLIPIVGGILLTSVTELSFNIFGFCAALFGCLATSTKTILAESLLHGYKFDSILHGTLCNHDTGCSSNGARRKRSYELVLHSPINLFVIDHHFLLRSAGLLSQFLYILCHPLNNCYYFQRCWQSQSCSCCFGLMAYLPEPNFCS
ncbi:GDP-mannose transporter GONST5 isoform X2 [Elaeis guineensis]|uniref:GDP-mannose transporter GONST5 isoform X2 n=1 Tax=Elaeis guineensis var. tenera TaxID=51953 RepID=UPI003C6D6DC4